MPDPDMDGLRSQLDALSKELHDLRSEQRDGLHDLNDKVDKINGTVARLSAEIGPGLPEPFERQGRESLRSRVHAVENQENVAKAIRDSYARSWGEWQKRLTMIGVVGAFVFGLLRVLGVGG